MPAYSDEKQPALSHGGGGLPEENLPRRPRAGVVLLAGKWNRKNEPPTQRNTPLFVFFHNSAPSVQRIQFGSDTLESSAWKPLHRSFFFFFFFPQTYQQPHPLHRHIFNSVITPQGGETAVQPPAKAASSVRSFLWDSAGVGGVRLHSPTAAGTEGRRGGSSDSPPFVKGRELAVSPRRFPRALYFAGFSISNNARTPTVVREQSGESISEEAPRLKGNLTRTYGRRGLAPRLFFVRRGEESHSSSFRDCHKGSAWQTVAHHLLEKKEGNYVRWNALFKLSGRRERWHAAAASQWLWALWVWFTKSLHEEKTDKNVITHLLINNDADPLRGLWLSNWQKWCTHSI